MTDTSRRPRHYTEAETERAAAAPPAHWSPQLAQGWIPTPSHTDDKYRRGVLAVRTGSAAYPGAAVLGITAAWRTGVGMLRFVPAAGDAAPQHGLPTPAAAVLAASPETVIGEPSQPGNVDAWLLGSGTDAAERSDAELDALTAVLAGSVPVVVDAGALDVAVGRADQREGDSGVADSPAILTPHQQEFARIWQASGLGTRPPGWPARTRSRRPRTPKLDARIAAATTLAAHLGATILLKGSTTVTATPQGQVYLAGPATPWLAAAGTGDVLGGILGALVTAHTDAIREDPEVLGPVGATAAVLHDVAARIAAGDTLPSLEEAAAALAAGEGAELDGDEPPTVTSPIPVPKPAGSSRPITASDVAAALPAAAAYLRSLPTRRSRRRRGSAAN